jgi:signal transduction histidine kinase/PAS domain-containing protein
MEVRHSLVEPGNPLPLLSWEAGARTLRCRSVSGPIELLGFPFERWRHEDTFLPETLFSPDRARFLDRCRAAAEGTPSVGSCQVRTAGGRSREFQLALDCVHRRDVHLLRGQMVDVAPRGEGPRSLDGPWTSGALERIDARFDRQLRHLYVSPSIQRLVGLAPAKFLGKTNEQLGMPSRLVRLWRERMLRVFRREEPQELDFQFLVGGGSSPPAPARFHARLVPEFDARGAVSFVMSIAEVYPSARARPAPRSSGPRDSLGTGEPLEARQPSPRKPRASTLSVEQRAAWLEQVSRTLAAQPDGPELWRRLEALALPLLGDQGGVEVLREQRLERLVSFPAAPREEGGPWSPSSPFCLRIIRAGLAQLLCAPSELMLQALARDEEHLRQLREVALQDFMAVPLLRGGEGYGCLWFASTDPTGRFGAAELALAEQLALLLSPALEAARLRQVEKELRARKALLRRKTESLSRVATALGHAMLPTQVAHAVTGEVRDALAARAAVVYRMEASGAAVELLQASGYGEATRGYEQLPLSLSSPITDSVKRREGVWVESGEAFRREYPQLAARFPGIEGAWVALPLLIEGEPQGVLAMSFERAHHFSEEERAFALALAQLCAQALGRVRLYHQLQEQVEEFRTLLNVLPVGIGIARDRECRHIEQNPAGARQLGLAPEQNASLSAPEPERPRGIHVFQKGHELEPGEMPIQLAAATGRPVLDFEFEIQAPERPRVTLLGFAAPLFDKERHPRGAIGAFLDVTELKRVAETQRFLAESSAALSASLDLEETYRTLTRRCVPTLASMALLYVQEEQGELHLAACAHEEPELEALLAEAGREGQPLGGALALRVMQTGQPRFIPELSEVLSEVDARGRALLARLAVRSLLILPLVARGRSEGVLVCSVRESPFSEVDFPVARDFAARAALAVDNARLYREAQEAIAVREHFLAVAGHELRTPLTALRLGLESLSLQPVLEDPHRLSKRVALCQAQGVRLGRLVEDLLDVGRLTAGKLPLRLEEVELAALGEDLVARMAPAFSKAGSAVLLRSQGPIFGWWDRLRLEQVLVNLLDNALKYGRGQPIEVEVSASPEEAVIRVRDHGIGISLHDQARIFNRFERAVSERHYGGLGLGLWITRELVTRMGGRIEVQSALDEGATFRVYLPRQEGKVGHV